MSKTVDDIWREKLKQGEEEFRREAKEKGEQINEETLEVAKYCAEALIKASWEYKFAKSIEEVKTVLKEMSKSLESETVFLLANGVVIPESLLNDRTREIIKNRQGFSPSTYQKSTEECWEILKKLSFYFPSRRLMAKWLGTYYWQGYKDIERELNRRLIRWRWKKLKKRERRKVLKALQNQLGFDALRDLTQKEKEVYLEEIFSHWLRPPKRLDTRRLDT